MGQSKSTSLLSNKWVSMVTMATILRMGMPSIVIIFGESNYMLCNYEMWPWAPKIWNPNTKNAVHYVQSVDSFCSILFIMLLPGDILMLSSSLYSQFSGELDDVVFICSLVLDFVGGGLLGGTTRRKRWDKLLKVFSMVVLETSIV